MWQKLLVVAALLLCSSVNAQVKISGPDVGLPKQELRYNVNGLTPPSLVDADGFKKLQEWSSKMSLMVDAPGGGEEEADADLSLGLGASNVRFRILFTPQKPGVYFLILDDNNSGSVAVKRITVGPVAPEPNPTPPPPGPVKVGRRTILLVREASDVTPAMNLTELALRDGPAANYLEEKQHQLLILSDDRGLPSNATKAVKEAWSKAKALPLPALAIINSSDADSSGVLFVKTIDPNLGVDEILRILKENGG